MITLDEIKTILGIDSYTNDTQLQAILDGVNQDIENYLGDISLGEKEIFIGKNKCPIGLMHKNATSIKSINGIALENTDYIILDSDEAYIKDFSKYTDSEFPKIKVVYEAGYETMPHNIILLTANRVAFEFAKDNGQVVAMEQMGPRSVEFFGSDKTSYNMRKEFFKGLSFYIPEHLKIW